MVSTFLISRAKNKPPVLSHQQLTAFSPVFCFLFSVLILHLPNLFNNLHIDFCFKTCL